jgi:ParB family chromosome partitioning protein
LQRADVHELDEARGYAALMQLQPDTYTVETLAEKIGRSEKYVYARLRLTHLVEDVQQAFYAGKLTVAHAFEIARLQPTDQQRALAGCFPNHRTAAALLKDTKAEAAVTVRELREWIESEIHLDLTNAPFDPQDETLLPAAGSCAACPKRTGNNPLLFPEIRQKSICTDRACYRAKVEAFVQIRTKPLEASGEKPLRVSHAPAWQVKERNADVLYEGHYRTVKKAECPQTKPAVVIDGADAGKVLHVCRDEQCKVHARVTHYEPSPRERAARAKELLAERTEKLTRVRVLNAIRKKLPATLSRPDLDMAALDYFERLGHDNHRRLCRIYGWEEKKTKTSWGEIWTSPWRALPCISCHLPRQCHAGRKTRTRKKEKSGNYKNDTRTASRRARCLRSIAWLRRVIFLRPHRLAIPARTQCAVCRFGGDRSVGVHLRFSLARTQKSDMAVKGFTVPVNVFSFWLLAFHP